jgi:glycosyltransferase involved in cell wall biosynthesis
MIIKDSGEPLVKTLEAVKPYIDSWCIVDTGSTDGSQKVVSEILSSLPGKLYEESFVDFATSRNRAFNLAETTGIECKYNIVLDDTYVLNGGEKLRKILQDGEISAYSIMISDENTMYDSIRITKVSEKLKYKYRVHENIVVPIKKLKLISDSDIYIEDQQNYLHNIRSNQRYQRDISMLLQDHKDNPKDMRIIFFLAQSYKAISEYTKAIVFYNKRIQIDKKKDLSDEVYLSHYNLGVIYKILGDWSKAEQNFMIAYNYRPYRAEPIYHITRYHFENNNFDKSYSFLVNLVKIPLPDISVDSYHVEQHVYLHDVPYLLAEVLLRKGKTTEAVKIIKDLLCNYPNDNDLKNMLYGIEKPEFVVRKHYKKLIVIHACNNTKPWCPTKYRGTGVSGSELMAMNMAKQFASKNYKVFLFTNCENLEGIYDDVEYVNHTKYEKFLEETYVNYLIVLRVSSNLKYYEHIEQVYFWIHDILPFGIQFQTHAVKFKKIVCLSNWHKQAIIKSYNFPAKMIEILGNSIDISKFNNELSEKIPYRFVYSSGFERGLDKLIRMFPMIRERYSNAELYVFVDKKSYREKSKYDYIHISDRISHEKLIEEYKKTDVWFYPTNFQETYCITALEAQVSKCLCVCSDLAGLKDIVGDRGVLFDNTMCDEDILQKLFDIVDDSNKKEVLIKRGYDWAVKQSHEHISKQWIDMFNKNEIQT